ncbi:MAG TPA: discoidin domain-containing protein [Vicinamibacterales bacterium]
MTSRSGEPRSVALPWLIAAVGYTAISIVYLWPVVTHLSSAFPHDPYDSSLTGVILFWDAHSVPLSQAWWDAPIFWPTHGALALSEHLLGISLLTTPLQWFGVPLITASNVAFVCAFPLTALAAHALAFACVKRHDVAAIAGCMFGFSPYRVGHLAHLQMMWVFAMPLALMALHRFVEGGRRGWLVLFGTAWLVQAAANGYFMLFFPVLLAAWVLWFVRDLKSASLIAAAWLVSTLPLVPVLLGYRKIHDALGLSRSINEIESLSADMTAVFAASPDSLVWHSLSRWSRPEGELFPGLICLVLVVAAIALAVVRFRSRPDPEAAGWPAARMITATLGSLFLAIAISAHVVGPWRWTIGSATIVSVAGSDKPLSIAAFLFLCTFVTLPAFRLVWRRRSVFWFYVFGASAMLVLSLGPHPTWAGTPVLFRAPYAWLMELPGFSEIRVPARFGMLFVLCLSVAAAVGFARLTWALSATTQRALAVAVVVVALVEGWPRFEMAPPASPIAALSVFRDDAPVIVLPLGTTDSDAAAEYRGMTHGRPNINGYSGYAPHHYQVLRIGLGLNDGAVLDELARDRDIIVAVDRHGEFERWVRVVGPRPVIADDSDWRLYRIAAGSGPPVAAGALLSIQSVTANFRNNAVGQMLDGKATTAWSTGQVQAGNESVLIDLGRRRDVSGVALALGPFALDFPRALLVECSADQLQWTECWQGSSTALAMRAAIDAPLSPVIRIPVAALAVRYIRLHQTAADPTNGWAIAELTVFGR